DDVRICLAADRRMAGRNVEPRLAVAYRGKEDVTHSIRVRRDAVGEQRVNQTGMLREAWLVIVCSDRIAAVATIVDFQFQQLADQLAPRSFGGFREVKFNLRPPPRTPFRLEAFAGEVDVVVERIADGHAGAHRSVSFPQIFRMRLSSRSTVGTAQLIRL